MLLVGTGQEFDGLKGVVHTSDGVGLGDNGGAEGAQGMAETCPRVWSSSISLKIHNPPLSCSSEDSPAAVPPASARHDCDDLAQRATRSS